MSDNNDLLSREDMLALIESGRELSAQVTLEALLQSVLAKASQLTDSPDTSVILSHEDREGLYVAAATGDKAEWVLTTFGKHSAKSIPIKGSKAGVVFETGNSIIENKVEDHFKGVDAETKMVTESMVCVPLRVGDQRMGAMQILNKRGGDYADHDRVLLEHFASQAAVAIKNAQMFESLLAHSGFYTRLKVPGELVGLMRELHEPAHSETLTILFADMRGFTQLCNLNSATVIQKRLNEFMSMLAEEIISCDGMVNKFLGDGVMALFRHEKHAERAVKAAFQIVERFREMKGRWNDESSKQLGSLGVGIGIVTDEVTIGAIGSEKVRDFTAIGSAVNLAAALEGQARDGKWIIANHLTYRCVKDHLEAETLEDYVLEKPGQTAGPPHKRYWLKESGEPLKERRIFISYSHLDDHFVQSQLFQPLKELGIDTWCAANDIPKGALWPAAIRTALSQCTWMIVVVSRNASESDWVRLEVDMAVGLGRMTGKIIPVQLDDSDPGKVNEYLVSMQMVDARGKAQVAGPIAKVINGEGKSKPG